jgi:integrase
LLFLDAGLKVGELCGLTRADVAGAGVTVHGSKGRTVKMSKRLATAMKMYLREAPRSGPLFTGRGGRALSHWRVRHIAAASAGASPTQLRRMFADRYLEQTGDPLELGRMLGQRLRVGTARPGR